MSAEQLRQSLLPVRKRNQLQNISLVATLAASQAMIHVQDGVTDGQHTVILK